MSRILKLDEVAWDIARKAVVYASVYGVIPRDRARLILRSSSTTRKEAVDVFIEAIKFILKNGLKLDVKRENGKLYCGLCKYIRYNGTKLKSEKSLVRHIFKEHQYWINAYAEKIFFFCKNELEKRLNGAKAKYFLE